ncbi:MAG: hypothetical protein OXH84_07330 [Gammaproteobacteria bacterium]|nr:hypothetical protein [Gammaproteobacteria bacterium]
MLDMLKDLSGEYFETLGILKLLKRFLHEVSIRFKKVTVQIEKERGPISREYGFTESALKINIQNKNKFDIRIKDVRVMFCKSYGFPVPSTAPVLRTHPQLPTKIESGSMENWYIPAEQLSTHLKFLYLPSNHTGLVSKTVTVHALCTTGSGKVYKSSAVKFSTDADSHWP